MTDYEPLSRVFRKTQKWLSDFGRVRAGLKQFLKPRRRRPPRGRDEILNEQEPQMYVPARFDARPHSVVETSSEADFKVRDRVVGNLDDPTLDVSNVRIRVRDQHVTLEGGVESYDTAALIQERCKHTLGVHGVTNKLILNTELQGLEPLRGSSEASGSDSRHRELRRADL